MEVGKLKYTWQIKNFSRVQSQKLNSDDFSLGPYKWKILAYPKGRNVENHLSIFLEVADTETLPTGWRRTAKFSFTLINQINNNLSRTNVTNELEFKETKLNWGFPSFISHTDLHGATKGFLVKDTCIIEADVTIYKDVSADEVHGPTEEHMDAFFGDLCTELFPKKVLSMEEEAKEALTLIEETLNMVPADVNNPRRMTELKNAFDVLCLLDVFTSEQKAELLSMKDNFINLPARAAQADKNIELSTRKENLDRKLGICLVEFEKAKEETMRHKQKIEEMKKKEENSLLKQKQMFKLSQELKAELGVLVKNWPENEVKIKAAEEEKKVVDTEWSKMKQFVSSLRKSA